ncbi:ExbD/TolR family protein [Psychroserpens algicola]|uniref:Biopolymer transporter ExbD n=1 Tax=Psychroserpens algicola TaxID=1719034 RepID=A0ABT0H8E0_9FLAO|nr:biopolymer transporter ExbD [Psychroserpens algicola]MCK8480629.1 biopolymer transporter ExbD [Psychroserpens algicola]
MKTSRRQSVQVNAGSMADIAFLLLIFFLVTAMIPNDKGINRKLPAPCPPNINCGGEIHHKNTLEVKVNSKDELLVENNRISINDLKDIAKDFLDNNGDGSCGYCNGLKSKTSSDNPKAAVISLTNDKQTSYDFYIKVQDELTKAYYELRNQYSETVLKKPSNELSKEELQNVRAAYPFILSEAELKH